MSFCCSAGFANRDRDPRHGRSKEVCDRLANEGDDGEHGQKRKRPMGKKKKLKLDPEHEQLSAKLSACARLATHDVSHTRF
jgi:hypothetical protein